MTRTFTKLGDKLLTRLVPSAKASAACWTEYCCGYKYCRYCCYHDSTGETNCGPYDYC
ncbi:hypothetical protein GCM10023085_27600 [Actinomadura viridis]|uniref:Uncharacterized protein n=1 Tax=Actinomadura viridis TaxID=58110 RepID=A0A931DA26_9ACTN|nr:hypothetical protein [Actinomadura viridis]MBG6087254.1 hypothetical protein [Actinomadura viridis]